jgi:serine/threonine-protein kinase
VIAAVGGGGAAFYLFASPPPRTPPTSTAPAGLGAEPLAVPGGPASPPAAAAASGEPAPSPVETVRVEDLPPELSEASAEQGSGKEATPGAARRTAPAGARPAGKGRARPADCDPPFTVDDKGIKRLKPGCL